MNTLDTRTPEVEKKHHRYIGSNIPWYVHLIWVGYWCFAMYYILTYLFPEVRNEFQQAPPAASQPRDNVRGK